MTPFAAILIAALLAPPDEAARIEAGKALNDPTQRGIDLTQVPWPKFEPYTLKQAEADRDRLRKRLKPGYDIVIQQGSHTLHLVRKPSLGYPPVPITPTGEAIFPWRGADEHFAEQAFLKRARPKAALR